MVKLISTNGVYDSPIPTYYIEDENDLTNIPAEAPAGTIVECNASGGFKLFMKDSQGNFNEL